MYKFNISNHKKNKRIFIVTLISLIGLNGCARFNNSNPKIYDKPITYQSDEQFSNESENVTKEFDYREANNRYNDEIQMYEQDLQITTFKAFNTFARDTVLFTTNSSSISLSGYKRLHIQYKWIQQHNIKYLLIEGHADERGTREYNIGLSARRAANVRNFFISAGFNPKNIKVQAYGKERPAFTCPSEKCWARNRRTVTIIK